MNTQLNNTSLQQLTKVCLLAIASSVILLLGGCAAPAPVKQVEVVKQDDAVVWPAPPEQARIRYLGDLKEIKSSKDKKKSMRDLLMGAEKKGNPSLSKPYGVHSDGKGHVYVADTGLPGLVVFDTNSGLASLWGINGQGALSKAVAVTSDAQGNVYVSDVKGKRVVVFDKKGNYVNAFGGKELMDSPAGIAFNETNQRVYVVDAKKHHISVFDPRGNLDFVIGENGDQDGNFNIPTNIVIAPDGNLIVADTLNFRVQILAPDGSFISKFGEVGDLPGDFSRLKGISTDTDGHIYTVDASFNNIQIFNQQGQLLLTLGEGGHSGPAGFYLPAGLHIDKNNHIFVADQYHQRIQMFEYLPEHTD